MNIVHMVFSFTNGGIENLLVDIMNNWSADDNIMLCVINNNVNHALLSKIELADNKKIICLNRPVGGGKVAFIRQLNKVIREFKTDIVHCHSNNAFKFCLPIKIVNFKIKMFLTVHDTNLYTQMKAIDCFLHKMFLTKIFAISKVVKQEIVNKNINSNKVEVVYNGVDVTKFLKKRNESNSKKEIVCIARLVPHKKGQDVLLRAIKELSIQREDFICRLVGGVPKEENNYLMEIKELIKELSIERYVELVGDCDNVPEVLSIADIFVLPSRYEGFGIAVIEAMLSKTVVIASDIEGPKEIIQDNEYGYLFPCEDYKNLASALNRLLDKDNDELINRAYEYVLHEFSIFNMLQGMSRIYQSIY